MSGPFPFCLQKFGAAQSWHRFQKLGGVWLTRVESVADDDMRLRPRGWADRVDRVVSECLGSRPLHRAAGRSSAKLDPEKRDHALGNLGNSADGRAHATVLQRPGDAAKHYQHHGVNTALVTAERKPNRQSTGSRSSRISPRTLHSIDPGDHLVKRQQRARSWKSRPGLLRATVSS